MSVTLVNNSPQLTVSTAGTRGLTGAHVVSAEFIESNLVITLSDGTVVNAGGGILSSSGSNNWIGQQAINGNVIISGSFIVSGSNTFINIGPASFSGSVNVSGSTVITGSLIVSGGTINVIGTNLISASQGVTLVNTTGFNNFTSSISASINAATSSLSASISSLSGSVAETTANLSSSIGSNRTALSSSVSNVTSASNARINNLEVASGSIRSNFNSYTSSTNTSITSLQSSASTAASVNDTHDSKINLLEIQSGSLVISASSLRVSASDVRFRTNALLQATQSLYSFSSSVNEFTSSTIDDINSLYSTVVSLNNFTSSVLAKSTFNSYTQSANSRLASIESLTGSISSNTSLNITSASLNNATASLYSFTSSVNDIIDSINTTTESILSDISSLTSVNSAQTNRINAIHISTASLNTFSSSVNSKFDAIGGKTGSYATTSSVSALSASIDSRLNSIEGDSESWGASTDVSLLNAFATSSLASITALQVTASSLIAYTTSSDADINNLEVSASSLVASASSLRTSASTALSTNNSQASSITSLNTFSGSVNASGSIINAFTSSVNSFTASVSSSVDSLTTISASLLVSASSFIDSASALATSASTALSTNNSQAIILNNIVGYTSSLQSAIDVTGGNLTVLGNLTVQGETTTLNTANLIVEDKLIELAKGTTTSVDANGAGIYISGADASITWNSSQNRIDVNKSINIDGNIRLSGTIDGTEISQLSSSYNIISASYLIQSASVSASIRALNLYTASNTPNITAIHTATASLNVFTSSINTFTASADSRLDDLEASIGGAGIGSTVNNLVVSASASVVLNTLQQTQLNVLLNSSPSRSIYSVIRLADTASNLTGQVTNQETRLISQTASINILFQSASSLGTSASLASITNQSQSVKLNSLENFTSSVFTDYTQSVSQSIAQIYNIFGGETNIAGKFSTLSGSIFSVEARAASLNVSLSAASQSYQLDSASFRNRINNLNVQSSSFLQFISGSNIGSYPSWIPFSSSVYTQFNQLSSSVGSLNTNAFLDSDQEVYSASNAVTTNLLYTSWSVASASIWSTATGLSRSINLKIQDVSGSITSRINTLVLGTGFLERAIYNAYVTSSNLTTESLNNYTQSNSVFTSSVSAFTSSVSSFTQSVSVYTSSLQNVLTPINAADLLVKNDLYVSGTITSNRMIVNTTINTITTSYAEGSNVFGDNYGDRQVLNGRSDFYGQINLYASGNDPNTNPVWLNVNSSITASGDVSASSFTGLFNNVSSQVTLSSTTGYSTFSSSLSQSISHSIAEVSSSLGNYSSSVATTTNHLSESVRQVIVAVSASLSASINDLSSSTATSVNAVSSSISASINSLSASINLRILDVTQSVYNVIANLSSSTAVLVEANRVSASTLFTTASNLSAYTNSLQQAISVTGSNSRMLGSVEVASNLIVSGNIVAQNYIVSSSVAYITTSFSSGSTKFGDDVTDNHNFTGSVYVVGSISSSATITAATHSGFILANNNVVSGAAQLVNLGYATTGSNTFNGNQTINANETVNGQLKVSGSTTLTGSVGVDLRSGSEFYVRNGVTRIDSVLFVTDNDYVNSSYVGGDVRVNDYLAGGYTAHYDGGVQITGSLRVNAGQNGSGSYFTGSVWVTGNEAVSGNLQVVGNSSVSGNFIATTISASSAVTASSLRVEGLTRINGEVDIDNTQITIGAGGNAVVDETRLNTLNLRVDSKAFFNDTITAISGSTTLLDLIVTNLSESRVTYAGVGGELVDNANFTYNGVVFKIGGGAFEVDDTNGNIRTSGSLSVSGLNISNNLNVVGAVGITSSLTVSGSTLISSSLRATSTASFGALTVTGSTILSNRLQVGTNAAISGNLGVIGSVALSSSLFVSGNITASANANISGDVAITGSLNAIGPVIAFGNSMTDNIYLSGNLEITGSLTRNTTNLRATGSTNPADVIYRLTEAQAWSSSFTTDNTSSGAWIRTPDEYLEYFVGQGSNKRRYITPVWLDETLYADDYFDISVVVGPDSDYVF